MPGGDSSPCGASAHRRSGPPLPPAAPAHLSPPEPETIVPAVCERRSERRARDRHTSWESRRAEQCPQERTPPSDRARAERAGRDRRSVCAAPCRSSNTAAASRLPEGPCGVRESIGHVSPSAWEALIRTDIHPGIQEGSHSPAGYSRRVPGWQRFWFGGERYAACRSLMQTSHPCITRSVSIVLKTGQEPSKPNFHMWKSPGSEYLIKGVKPHNSLYPPTRAVHCYGASKLASVNGLERQAKPVGANGDSVV